VHALTEGLAAAIAHAAILQAKPGKLKLPIQIHVHVEAGAVQRVGMTTMLVHNAENAEPLQSLRAKRLE
jgi:hypothetical protein